MNLLQQKDMQAFRWQSNLIQNALGAGCQIMADEIEKFDYVIVGAGSAGCIISISIGFDMISTFLLGISEQPLVIAIRSVNTVKFLSVIL